MTLGTCSTTVIALIIVALPAWGQQYLLYSPQPVTSSQPPPAQDGVLVQEIEIHRGDTLSGLSRKFSGRGMYFPQILLFNSIKDPNLIYAGDTLRVPMTTKEGRVSDRIKTKPAGAPKKQKKSGGKKAPLSAESAAPDQKSTEPATASSPATELSLTDLKPSGTKKSRARGSNKKTAVQAQKAKQLDSSTETSPIPEPVSRKTSDSPAPTADAIAGQKLFEAATKAYRLDDCNTALELLDRYLVDNPGSPLAADANLYKADCYLKLSAQ